MKSRNLRKSQSRCYFEVTVEEIIWDFTFPTVPIGRWEKLRQTLTVFVKSTSQNMIHTLPSKSSQYQSLQCSSHVLC